MLGPIGMLAAEGAEKSWMVLLTMIMNRRGKEGKERR